MKKNIRVIIAIAIGACLCIGYYYYLTHRSGGQEQQLTEMEQVIARDLDKSYPATPREVIRFYNRILFCIFNEEYEEDELEAMAAQVRRLMDDELLAKNPENSYLMSLEMDLEEYSQDKTKIVSATVSTSKEVVYKTVEGYECAYVDVSYYLKGTQNSRRAQQTYILRKDQQDRWKILGFYMQE